MEIDRQSKEDLMELFKNQLKQFIGKPSTQDIKAQVTNIVRKSFDYCGLNRYNIECKPNCSNDSIDVIISLGATNTEVQTPVIKTNDDYFRKYCLSLFTSQYDEHIALFLTNRLQKMVRRVKDNCISHLRYCDIDNKKEKDEYIATRNSGCCGSYEASFLYIRDNKTKTFWIGFNYGH